MKSAVRLRIILALLAVAAIGLAMKLYPGPGRWWVNNWGPASVAYEIFFMLLALLVVPRKEAVTPIAVGVCLVTCVLEVLQLWQPPWLQAVRRHFLGAALLGNEFSCWDLPAYPIGCILGWFLLHRLLLHKTAAGGRVEGP